MSQVLSHSYADNGTADVEHEYRKSITTRQKLLVPRIRFRHYHYKIKQCIRPRGWVCKWKALGLLKHVKDKGYTVKIKSNDRENEP